MGRHCIAQLSKIAEAIKDSGNFTEPESSETIVRGWHHEGLAVRPQHRMIGHTGFLIFINRAPIIWYSKRQNTVESSAFSSEFIAAKTCVEHITALRYKLRMFGVPVDGPTKVLCD